MNNSIESVSEAISMSIVIWELLQLSDKDIESNFNFYYDSRIIRYDQGIKLYLSDKSTRNNFNFYYDLKIISYDYAIISYSSIW